MDVAITGSCGHTANRNLTDASGNEPGSRSLKKSIAYWSTKDCTDCYRNGKQKETANTLNQFGSLPALAGSERQVAWATRIREQQLVKVSEQLTLLEATRDTVKDDSMMTLPLKERAEAITADFRAKAMLLATVTDAKFWIDTRDENGVILIGGENGHDHSVKFNLETGKVILSQRGQQKRIEYAVKKDYWESYGGVYVKKGTLRSKMVGGNKFYEREVI